MDLVYRAGADLLHSAYAISRRFTGGGWGHHCFVAVVVPAGTAGGYSFYALPFWAEVGTIQ